jgi:hypothetical protein
MVRIILHQTRRDLLLTEVENVPKPKAKATLTGRETATRMLERAVKRSEIKLDQIGNHGQVSRQIHDKENLSFHHMVATWPAAVMRELTLELALHYGFEVVQTVKRQEPA